MVKLNKKPRLTCFLCRYEITKYNKSTKHVIYNKTLRPICKHCNKNRHKSLDSKYKNIDTQCKICLKPTLYKKCIACSICDHFCHGKCLDLSKQDIEKIENVCGFFTCTKCNQDIFPKIVDDQPKLKRTVNTKVNLKTVLHALRKSQKCTILTNTYCITMQEVVFVKLVVH